MRVYEEIVITQSPVQAIWSARAWRSWQDHHRADLPALLASYELVSATDELVYWIMFCKRQFVDQDQVPSSIRPSNKATFDSDNKNQNECNLILIRY